MSLSLERLSAALADRYRIERELGQGGMATVYLAHDLRHDRQVAIKVVHPDLAAALGPERFLAEIKTTARLQHPHILPLLDSGEADGVLFYVMPFIAGESLRDRLKRDQQLPIDEAVRIARQVADALGHAHGQGIVHRDIKPENILLQEGHALVADFGIALAVTAAGGPRMTQTGLSLGTPQYMSPEQAMGERTLDARTDVYALGAVTYEMLTGEAPFTGATVQAIVAKVLSAEPQSLTLTRKTIPAHVELAVLKALAKLPADRWAKASEFGAALADGSTSYATSTVAPRGDATTRTSSRSRALLTLATALALVGGGSALWFATRAAPAGMAMRFDVALPDSVSLYNVSGRRLALSRDGTQLVVVATRHDTVALYLRRMEDAEFHVIAGTDRVPYVGNVDPVFSPDGTMILFRSQAGVMKVPAAGGSPERVGPDAFASWTDRDRIVFALGDTLWETATDGGAKRVIHIATGTELRLSWLSALPGGRHALAMLRTPRSSTLEDAQLGVVSLQDGTVDTLGITGTNPLYAAAGHVVFGKASGGLFAVPFSLDTRKVSGQPSRIVEDVWVGPGGALGADVSSSGTLVYHLGDRAGASRVLWEVGLEGKERRLPGGEMYYFNPHVSPNGSQVAVENNVEGRYGPEGAIMLLDLRSGARQLLTSPGEGMSPEWTRDGRRVAFLKFMGAVGREIVSRPWDRSAPDELLLRDSAAVLFEFRLGAAGGWSALRQGGIGAQTGRRDLFLAPAGRLAQSRPFVASPTASEVTPAFSPDGRWLAYASDESGRPEVYVQAVPGPGPRVQISAAGGVEPLWAPNGATLFYRGVDRQVVAARLQLSPLRVSRWDTLFVDRFVRGFSTSNWSIFPSGKSFLMIGGQPTISGPKAIVNWTQLPAQRQAAAERR
ncbi:MAG: serine/threonine-protein kinase [Gemmatimonadaceae bacterium]|nr:serine/threonine-protein kinase [Gemmatimonadaceae bacterium]